MKKKQKFLECLLEDLKKMVTSVEDELSELEKSETMETTPPIEDRPDEP